MTKHGPTYGIVDPDYARVFTIARCVAWQEGYALVMHGSFTRDLDLIAIPWTDRATDAEHLVRRVALALDDLALLVKKSGAPSQATQKPHGRLAWTLTFKTFGDPRFVDLSVMPRAAPTVLASPDTLDAFLNEHPALENGPAGLADATPKKSPSSQDQEIAGLREELRRTRDVLAKAKAFHDRDSGCNGFTADYECLRWEINDLLGVPPRGK